MQGRRCERRGLHKRGQVSEAKPNEGIQVSESQELEGARYEEVMDD